MKIRLFILFSGFSLCTAAAGPFREIAVPPFPHVDESSIISPGGKYALTPQAKGKFELYEIKNDARVLATQYLAWTSPYPDLIPTRSFFVFSPDEKLIVADNYYFTAVRDSVIHWAEIWDISARYIVKNFAFADMERGGGWKFTYDVQRSLDNYYARRPCQTYSPSARAVFTPDGSRLCFLYPRMRVFDARNFTEISGAFNLMGADMEALGVRSFRHISAPFFIRDWKALVAVNGTTMLFNDLDNSITSYFKLDIEGNPRSLDVSPGGKWVIIDNRVYDTDYMTLRATLPCDGFASADQSVFLSCSGLFRTDHDFSKLNTWFSGNPVNVVPSLSREFLYVMDRTERKLKVFTFTRQPELRQEIRVQDTESVFRESDNGRILILRDAVSGKIRILERVQEKR